ncbi:MAG: hemerythrin domain-containing protein [Rhodoferax sp.]|nr:hemerythrin domain-containing protein [Rhodoferax sp.]
MQKTSLQTIRDEHASLAAMLRSLIMMLDRGPRDAPEAFFDVMRAMLFYVAEFPERQHHPKETTLLFPRVLALAPQTQAAIAQLEQDHQHSETAVRELQHLLLAWELLGDVRQAVFDSAVRRYVSAYLEHMQLEETAILPVAERSFSAADWEALDHAFAGNTDPLSSQGRHDPSFDRLFTRIVMRAPAPIGVGG